MAKRVSLRGKGVELFFGGAPREVAPAVEQPTEAAPFTSGPESAQASVHARTRSAVDEALLRALAEKQWLASSTFRFHPEELDRLDALADAVNRAKTRRVSKNDLVRLGLLWLLNDYDLNAGRSLVGRLLDRV